MKNALIKKILLTFLSAVLIFSMLSGCGKPDNGGAGTGDNILAGNVKTGGSTSVENIMTVLIYEFEQINGEVTVDYEMNGSGDGIKNTLSGLYEIGHSSRDLKTDGTEDGLEAKAYAIDGIAIIVNKANTISDLTTEQIRKIYTGEIKNWSEVGGADKLITVVTREEGSGTYDTFCETIGLGLKNRPETNIVRNANTCNSTGAIQTLVNTNANAIGYISFSEVDNTKVDSVKYNSIEISEENLKNGSYELKRDFYMIVKTGTELSKPAEAFMNFVMGDMGQEIVESRNLISVR